jgi:hypothetical protein
MNFQPKHLIHALRATPLEKVLAGCGARRDTADLKKWHTARGVLSVQGIKFMNWSMGVGGGGAIDLAMHLKALDFKGAVHWLRQQSPILSPLPLPTSTAPLALNLPASEPSSLGRVRNYLARERSLPLELLEPLIQSGTIYADARANAVFLLRTQTKRPVGAELRGTSGRCWRGLAPGSRKDLGFFGLLNPPPGALILCESAIDALSCRALHPELSCVSTAGARPNPGWLVSLIQEGRQIYCGFDSDTVGEQMTRIMIALHPTIRRLRPAAHDWNDQLKALRHQRSACQPVSTSRPLTTWKEETRAFVSSEAQSAD